MMTRRLSTPQLVSALAIATGMIASQTNAAPKGFLGNHVVAFGDVGVSTSTDTTNIFVNSATAVIDWTPDDNAISNGVPITFLDSNGTANFQGFSDFAVLNRLNIADNSRQILLNGAINSSIGQSVGGKIFFYSPSGFIVGSGAAINVGSLLLSASPIAVDGNGSFITGNTVTFGQAPNILASIVTATGSQINAYGSGSYVALVAPKIVHSGTIRTDTAAALVAAEAGTITFSPDGLYNIQVTNGTDDPNGIDIDGGTITRNSAVEGGNHRAYLVAVARNDAVTMLVRNGGSVGFETATSALVENNVVVLSGGYNVNGTPNIPSGAATVGLTIDNANFSSDTLAILSGGATVTTSTGATNFGNNLDIYAGADSFIQAINGNTMSIGGTLTANVDKFGSTAQTTGNLLRFSAYGNSTLTVGGNVFLSAQAYGTGTNVNGTNAGNATGGTVIVQTGSGSTIGITGRLDINVDGYGGSHNGLNGAGGNGTGGIAHILANGGSGSMVTVSGPVTVSATGRGGSSGECGSCQITGGSGSGGTILLQALVGSGNLLNLNNAVTLTARGDGGAGDIVGGAATGGTVQLTSGDAGAMMVTGALNVSVEANGGFGINDGVTGGTGGAATGGYASIGFSGAASSIDLIGSSLFSANATGGSGLNGGAATGGWVNLQASSNGALNATFLGASANALGGTGQTGGAATGGRAWVQAISSGDIVVNDLSLSASGLAGQSGLENGATGTGGYVIASASNATLTVTNTLDLEANGRGGFVNSGGKTGGSGIGGQADIFADNGATVTLSGTVAADAKGQGGNYINDLSTGGNGTGGRVFFQASNGALLDAASNVALTTNGIGGFSFGDCSFCGGTGGNGTGGQIVVQTFGGATTRVNVGGTLSLDAIGFGISGYAGAGGNGIGGSARVVIAGAGTLDVTTDLIVTADGRGGGQGNGGTAGNGTGGFAEIAAGTGNNIIGVDGVATVSARGLGGNASGTGSIGGNGAGGVAQILTQGGTSSFNSDVTLIANGEGGGGLNGAGGNGIAGGARMFANGGDINVGADLTVNALSIGGDGDVGGDAIAFIGADPRNTSISDARVVATNGDISVAGATALDASAFGGNGANGGDGGNAVGGYATVHAANSNLGPSSVTLGGVSIRAEGTGGAGGAGVTGNAGGDGGNGGSGSGGFIPMTGSAGNGTLVAGDVFASASAYGGVGGNGGSGDGLGGGNGGDGGGATGGLLLIGTESGDAQATASNTGSATFATITAQATAYGGDGGGFSFGSPFGLPGNGGAAQGGQSLLLVRGSSVTVGDVSLDATAYGGNGGFDSIDGFGGTGGNATSGQVGVEASNRFNFAAQRGALNAGNIVGTAGSFGGLGAIDGTAGSSGGLRFNVINSDATIASVSLTGGGDFFDPTSPIAGPSTIEVLNGTVAIAGGFAFTTPGAVSMWSEGGNLSAASITVSADNFIHDVGQPAPVAPGTFTGDTISLATAQDLIVDAHLSSPNTIVLTAPALVQVLNVTSGGSVLGDAGTDFTAANITAADGIDIFAGGSIALGVLNAGLGIGSGTGAIFLDAIGSIVLGDATALGSIEFTAGTTVTGGNLTSGLSIGGDANGAIILGNLSAGLVNPQGPADEGFSIGIASGTSIVVGNAAGAETVGFATLGALTTGNINAGSDVLAMVSGDMNFGSITTGPAGRTYLADSSMFIAAGGVDNFDANLVFPFAPVPTLGSITITGPVSTGSFQAAAGTNFTTGSITANTIDARVGGLSTLNGLWQAPDVELWSNDLDISATGGIDAGNSGSITLVSTNTTQALIGDGLTGTGYQLSNAEFGRLSSGSLFIAARGDASAPIDMLIGDLNITGPLAGSTIDDPNGSVVFVTGDPAQLTVGGVIRVVGDVRATGFQANNTLEFITGQFELDADTGSILVEQNAGMLGGILDITADRVHVASGAVLQKLTDNPLYAGREADLAAPIAVARPDGVIAADTIYVSPTEAVLVQNTGTTTLRAGFRARYAELFPPEGAAPGSIELIVNGQLETQTGRLTGVDVRDALIDILDIAVYTDNSSINGCPLTGECSGSIFPPGYTPTPGIQQEITLIARNPLPPPDFGNEDFIDDNDEETDDGATSPITPPQPLFDTSALDEAAGGVDPIEGTPMRSTSGLEQKGDVDDPVSGGGNPALMDVPPAPPTTNQEKQP